MIKNPIQEVTNKLQYRAIGIVKGIYKPNNIDQLNRGTLTDKEGKIIETVILGKAIALIKKYINLEKDYFWIVYPKNKNINNLHLQVAGIWDPYQLNQADTNNSEKDSNELLVPSSALSWQCTKSNKSLVKDFHFICCPPSFFI